MAMRVVILREGTAMEAFKQVISFFMYFLINNGIYNETGEIDWRMVELVT